MARRKPLDRYSQEYLKLFSVAATKRVTIACDSPQQAENMRNELYTCRKVIYEEGDEALAASAQNVRFFINTDIYGTKLIAEPIRQQKGDTDG